MTNYKSFDLLEAVELWAEDVNRYNNACVIESEQMLSELFDENIAPLVVEEYGEDDYPAMNDAFSNYMDMLCGDDLLHPEQVNNYEYVGKYS